MKINVETTQITRMRRQNDNEMKTRHGETKQPHETRRTVVELVVLIKNVY